MRTLIPVFRDQLNRTATVLLGANPAMDAVVMTEGAVNRGPFPEHKQRLALSLAAMRHFREDLRAEGWTVHYAAIDSEEGAQGPMEFLRTQINRHQPDQVAATEPGRYEDLASLKRVCADESVPIQVYEDDHFLVSHQSFADWAEGRKELTLEYFYREQRRAHDVLLTEGGEPEGGAWNFDEENRASFGADGPGLIPPAPRFDRDETTRAVLTLVQQRFPDAPGTLESFPWPVTPAQAEDALEHFIADRLPHFGTYQDAMWTNRPFLYHSRLSAALNLKLLDPELVIRRVEAAYRRGEAPINAVEGCIRQVLGWREFVRGVYWEEMPEYLDRNALDSTRALPDFYWDGKTDMRCLNDAVGHVLEFGYTHHIVRLMVLGLFGLLYEVDPQEMNAWHEAMYVDAWEWVSAPNVIGMALYADGGVMGTKPYTASGKYIDRMSNYCSHCPFQPDEAVGDDACPFTTLYWDFLDRHEERLSSNHRMNFQLANLRRKSDEDRSAIAERATVVRDRIQEETL